MKRLIRLTAVAGVAARPLTGCAGTRSSDDGRGHGAAGSHEGHDHDEHAHLHAKNQGDEG